jgi:hypothetical protein
MTFAQYLTYLGSNLTFPIDGSGTTNKVAKFSDANTLGNSQIEDDGSTIAIGTSPVAYQKFNVSTTNVAVAISGYTTKATGSASTGLDGSASGAITGVNTGVSGIASNATKNIGGSFTASGGTAHALKLQDGTEGVGKFFKSITAVGEGNWSDIAISDITSLTSTLSGKEDTSNKNATNGYIGRSAGKIIFQDFDSLFTSFLYNANTAGRTYTFQDRDGTIADNTDLATKADKNLTLNRQTASYTLVAGDNGKLIEMNVGSANNVTINDSLFSAGNQIVVAQYGAGQTSFVAGAGVTIRSASGKLKLTGQYSMATIICISATEFYLAGDLTA